MINEMISAMDEKRGVSKIWIALKRLDYNDDRITALREVLIPTGAESAAVRQIIFCSFGLNSDTVTVKLRNSRGSMIPLNSSLPANRKHTPYVLEVVKIFQHELYHLCFGSLSESIFIAQLENFTWIKVVPKPRTVAMTVINKSVKTRLQSIIRRMERLEELVPEMKLRYHRRLNQEMEFLSDKLVFLNKRMQMADSQCWRGMFKRPPLW